MHLAEHANKIIASQHAALWLLSVEEPVGAIVFDSSPLLSEIAALPDKSAKKPNFLFPA